MACVFCGQAHEKARIDFQVDTRLYVNKEAEYCPVMRLWVIKFSPLVDERAGVMTLSPSEVKQRAS